MSVSVDFEQRLLENFTALLKQPTPTDPESRDALREALESSKKLARLYGGDVGAQGLAAIDTFMQMHGFEATPPPPPPFLDTFKDEDTSSENPLKRCTASHAIGPFFQE